MRCVAIRHDASMYKQGRIVTDRNATHDKRIRVGRALDTAWNLGAPVNIVWASMVIGRPALRSSPYLFESQPF